jgi:hypothetical protein
MRLLKKIGGKVLKLYAPNTYWEASPEQKAQHCNGCGAKDGIKVPDTFYGLDIKEACNVHDWMYKEGTTKADFLFSNAIFLLNLVVIVIDGSNWFTKTFRLLRATKYFVAVAVAGSGAFWKDKKQNELLNITYKGSFR